MAQQNDLHNVLSFANQNPSCHLATSEENKPCIRGLLMWFADETGFYFHTSSTKRLAKQIVKNPRVEAAFLKSVQDPSQLAELRISGRVEIIEDSALEKRLYNERPWLLEYENLAPESKLVIFKVSDGEAFIWDMSDNLREAAIQKVKI